MARHAEVAKLKSFFLDRKDVIDRLDNGTAAAFRKVGGRTRLRAKSSIRNPPKKKKFGVRKGRPPFNRTGLLKKFIFFSLDPAANSVVTGPVKLDKASGDDVPRKLEEGDFPYMRPAFEYALQGVGRDFRSVLK